MTQPGGGLQIDVRRHQGAQALRDLAPRLRSVGLLPAPIVQMDPEYLAEGCEGESPGALVAFGDERPVAYLPYVVRRVGFPLRFGPAVLARLPHRQLRVMGYQTLEPDNDVILDAFLDDLALVPEWQVLQVSELPPENPLARYLPRAPAAAVRSFSVVCKTLESWNVRIAGTFEDYLRRRFNSKTRYNLRREVRLLEAHAPGQILTKVYTSEGQVDEFLAQAECVARKTYQSRLGFGTIRATPEMRRSLAYLAQMGRWRSYLLFVGGEPAAFCYATIRYGALEYDIIGYDPRLAHLHPGKVLLYRILEDLFATQVVNRLDFGIGPAEYKRLFSTSQHLVLEAVLYRPAAYPRCLVAFDGLLNSSWNWLNPRVLRFKERVKRYLRDRGRPRASRSGGVLRGLMGAGAGLSWPGSRWLLTTLAGTC